MCDLTPEAVQDLRDFKKFEQSIIIDAIQTQLPDASATETRNRFRRNPPDTADSTLMKLSRLVGQVYDRDLFESELIGEPAPTNPG